MIEMTKVGRVPKLLILGFILALILAWCVLPSAEASTPEAYNWRNVAIGGGGYVTGMVIHPAEPDLVYIRTDIGGAHRWDPVNKRWIQLFDKFPEQDWNLYGIDSIAVDPSNPDMLYVAAGKFDWGDTDILKSTDRGATWSRSGFTPNNYANGATRNLGERLAVDPNNGNVIYMGTRSDGLWKSTTAASSGSWQQVASFPTAGAAGKGLPFVIFDKSSGSPGNTTPTIYVGARSSGVYRSTDGGSTWNLLSGSPLEPNRALLASNGTLYVSHTTGVAKFDGTTWTDISPSAGKYYIGITADPSNPDIIMTVVYTETLNGPIYRSTNGGAAWTQVSSNKHKNVPWWPPEWWSGATSSLTIDPHYPNRVWYTDFFGTWRTDDISVNPSNWYTYEQGHEEVVTFTLKSTPTGASLLSGHADVDGMRHTSLTAFPGSRFAVPRLGDTTSIDFQETNPNFVVRVGGTRYENSGGAGYSIDNGATWNAMSLPQQGKNGRVAVSANSETIVWVPEGGAPFYSTNRGTTWKRSSGAPITTVDTFWAWHSPLVSDRVNGNTFYLLDKPTGNFYRSTNSGANWSVVSTLPVPQDYEFRIASAPGMAGEVWTALNSGGLYRSSNSGGTWIKLSNVQRAKLVAFGKYRTGSNNPSVFVYGTVDNANGIFRSDDMGATWVKIDVPEPTVGNGVTAMEGDRQVWGRVYIGTNGSGVYYGEPAANADTQAPTAPSNLAVSSTTGTTASLAWTASTDNAGVTGYKIYRNGTEVGTSAANAFTDAGLAPQTTYTYTVKAFDAAGNLSAASNSANGTTGLPPSEYIIDNSAAEFTGSWTVSTFVPHYYGANYSFNASQGSGADKARWRPSLYTAGNYAVYYWLPDGDSSRASNAPFTVYFNGGSQTYPVNESVSPGGQWILLGVHPFASGTSGYVELTDNANGSYVIADAIKFVKQ
jgi:hypothetical protein